jgi:hypothetical protein
LKTNKFYQIYSSNYVKIRIVCFFFKYVNHYVFGFIPSCTFRIMMCEMLGVVKKMYDIIEFSIDSLSLFLIFSTHFILPRGGQKSANRFKSNNLIRNLVKRAGRCGSSDCQSHFFGFRRVEMGMFDFLKSTQ